MVLVISIDVYPFWVLFHPSQICLVTLRIQEYVFYGCKVLTDSNKTKIEISDQEDFSVRKQKDQDIFSPILRM